MFIFTPLFYVSSLDFRHILRRKCVVCISKCFQLQGGFAPPGSLTRGFAPGPHWGLRPRGPHERARHERQRSGSFFVRTGSLAISNVNLNPAVTTAQHQQSTVSPVLTCIQPSAGKQTSHYAYAAYAKTSPIFVIKS